MHGSGRLAQVLSMFLQLESALLPGQRCPNSRCLGGPVSGDRLRRDSELQTHPNPCEQALFAGVRIWAATMRPDMITQIIRKQFCSVTDVCLIEKVSPRQLMCVTGTCTESTLWRCPNYMTELLPESPVDVLCIWEINSYITKCLLSFWAP